MPLSNDYYYASNKTRRDVELRFSSGDKLVRRGQGIQAFHFKNKCKSLRCPDRALNLHVFIFGSDVQCECHLSILSLLSPCQESKSS
ncbi:hypothetical protein RB195_017342 [Necator americanus]|uniref:Uncharacterized protein n=1 Tax=Necator americanus TaxID=51031 RepID=A0ABR1C7X1_NECAM